jgi:hypothetical protein
MMGLGMTWERRGRCNRGRGRKDAMDRSSYQSKEDVEPSVHFNRHRDLAMQVDARYARVMKKMGYNDDAKLRLPEEYHPYVASPFLTCLLQHINTQFHQLILRGSSLVDTTTHRIIFLHLFNSRRPNNFGKRGFNIIIIKHISIIPCFLK